jgi:hypothetical protein
MSGESAHLRITLSNIGALDQAAMTQSHKRHRRIDASRIGDLGECVPKMSKRPLSLFEQASTA